MVQAGGPFLPNARGSGAKTCPSHDRLTSWAPHSEVAKWIWGPGVQAPCRFSTSRPCSCSETPQPSEGRQASHTLQNKPVGWKISLLHVLHVCCPSVPLSQLSLKDISHIWQIWHIFKNKTEWERKGARSPLFVRFKFHQKLIFQNYFLLNVNVKVMNEIIRHFWKYNIYYFLMTLSEVITSCLLSMCVCVCMCVWCGICVYVFMCDVVCVYIHTFHTSAILVSHKKKRGVMLSRSNK